MLILNGDRPTMADTERTALDWLRTSGMPGVAISGCHTPGGETDILVITPDAVIAIEVKGLVRRIPNATLWCPLNGRWRVDGIDGDPVHVRAGDTSPYDQIGAKIFGAKNVLEPSCGPVHVDGLVLVVAHPGCFLSVPQPKGPTPFGAAVIAGATAGDLTSWIRRRTARRDRGVWTTTRVLAALAALDTGAPYTAAELAAEGFPAGTGTDYTAPSAPPPAIAAPRPRRKARRFPTRPPRPVPAARRKTPVYGLIPALLVIFAALALMITAVVRGAPDITPPTSTPAPAPTPTAPATDPTGRNCYPFTC